jgi:AcrR family transcriptional regulator
METTFIKPSQSASSKAARLNRDDWLDAAFQAAVEDGFDGVRVLLLAQTLGVTRGSFYWHFKDHADLITALLERWRVREAQSIQRMQLQASKDPAQDLEILLDAALAYGGEDLSTMRFELAVSALGRRDPAVAEMLLRVDQARMALIASKFALIVPDATTATDLAALFYLAIAGSFQALSRIHTKHPTKQYLQDIIGRFLVRKQAG